MTRFPGYWSVRPAALLVAAAALLAPLHAFAQTPPAPECLRFVKNLKRTPNCYGDPLYDKYFEPTKLRWKGTSYLVVNTGNDLDVFDISSPLNPVSVTRSSLMGGNLGDSDYDLGNYSMCDSCRYGIANFKVSSVLFDLGTGGVPKFGSKVKYQPAVPGTMTGFTFPYNGQQYVVSQELGGSCAAGSPVFLMAGIAPEDLTQVGCLGGAGTPPGWRVQNGVQLGNTTDNDYLYVADSGGKMFIFKVGGSTSAPTFSQTGPQLQARMGLYRGMGVDRDRGLAALTSGSAVKLYDLSNLGSPVELASHDGTSTLAAIGGSLLFQARAAIPASEALFDTDDFQSPSPNDVDPNFWLLDQTWNQNACEFPDGAVMSDDGTALYTSNYAVVKVIDASACGAPVAPTAHMTVAPASAFPGDSVTVTNASSGGARSAIWVTDAADPLSTLRFGSRTMAAATPPLPFTVPQDLAASQQYYAHVAVETDAYPCDPLYPAACGEQLTTQLVGIRRDPVVTGVTYTPSAPLSGETVTFSATAEGTPSSWTWDVASPTGKHTTGTGNPMSPSVTLNENGTWTATATAHYLHYSATGALYTAFKSVSLGISSVFAAFTVPTNPLNTNPITLDASASRATAGATLSYDWSLTGPTPYTCPHTVQCTIPADTLSPGSYTVGLTVHNTSDGESSIATPETMNVADGSIALDVNWSPTSPEIGEQVTFGIQGVPGGVDQAVWDFGGTGCSGFDRYTTCTPDFYPYCMSQVYKYSSGGPKTVKLTVTIDGNEFTTTKLVSVQYTGTCTTTPPPTPTPTPPPVGSCTYSVSPTTTSVPFWGGQDSVYVTVSGTGCSWAASSNNPGWLTGVTPASGSVSGMVTFTATANPWGARTGSLTVAGRTVTVTQPAHVATDFTRSNDQPDRGEAVTFTVDPALEPVRWDFGSTNCAGESRILDCSLVPAACRAVQWSYPKGGLYDVTLTTKSGSQTRTLWVQPNGECPVPCTANLVPDPGFTMSPEAPVAGEAVTFTHVGLSSCETSLSPVTASLPAQGGSRSFTVTTGAQCSWTVTTNGTWITVTSPLSGTGPGQVSYTVQANTGPARSAAITVNGVAHTVTQEAGSCTVGITPTSASFEAVGGTGVVNVTADAGCAWTAVSNSDWITVTAPAAGTGPGTVEYQVAANTGDARSGVVNIDGATHTVSQAASSDVGHPGSKALAIGFGWDPPSPEIGQVVQFNINGYTGKVRAEWNFGGPGCSGFTQTSVCDPLFTTCLNNTYKFASGGPHTVSVTVKDPSNGAVIGTATNQVVVQNSGSCGGAVVCTYSLSPTSATAPAAGASGSFTVSTAAECSWTATSNRTWLGVTAPAGEVTGPGTVTYSVGPNSDAARSGTVTVKNRTFTLSQDAAAATGDDSATEWHWTVSRAGATVATSGEESFQHVFTEPGTYHVHLVAGNCVGSRSKDLDFQVLPAAADTYLVPAAVHTAGLNDTLWKTDLKLFNPCAAPATVTVEYLPENTNNASTAVPWVKYSLAPKATRVVNDVVQQIPDIVGEKGSLRFSYEGGDGCTPLVISRTYNDTAFGTFGQFVPAVPVQPVTDGQLVLTGLVSDFYYRTNLGIANFGPDDAWVTITLYDEKGDQLGDHPVTVKVYGNSTRQVVGVAETAGVLTDVNIFSARIDAHGADVAVYASVVDNQTGDSVLYQPLITGDQEVWVPGIAHLAGLNDSEWRSDISFFNPSDQPITADVSYVPSENLGKTPGMEMTINPGAALYFVDVLGESNMLPTGPDSKGYFVVSSADGSPLPEIAARTYNLAPDGGTFGQTLKTFSSSDMIGAGQSGFLPGVTNTPSNELGFRTNLGLLSPETATKVDIILYDTQGRVTAELPDLWVMAGKLQQFDLFKKLGIEDLDIDASVEVKVLEGGPLGVYASVVDNRTQDPVLIPAIRGVASP